MTVTQNGNRWATTLSELSGAAGVWDQMYAEEPDVALRDGSRYWSALDEASAQLGGPAHPELGTDR